jgi:hypothetical protein
MRLRSGLAEFVTISGFNAATLGFGLLVVPLMLDRPSRASTVLVAHAWSAAVSYLFCRFVVWRNASGRDAPARAATFFALAAVSAGASVIGVHAIHARPGSAWFVGLNYFAVATVAVVKFLLQRKAMTEDRHRFLFKSRGIRPLDRPVAEASQPVGYRARPEATTNRV